MKKFDADTAAFLLGGLGLSVAFIWEISCPIRRDLG